MGIGSLRQLRHERRLTLEALAQKAGTTKSYLSKIERGHSTPSIAVAMKLADALSVDVAELFGEPDTAASVDVNRADTRDFSRASTPPGSSAYLGLADRLVGKQMIPFLLSPPSSGAPCQYREHEGDEFVMALSGTVELRLTNRSEILESGDSAYFRGGVAHYFRTIGPEPAQILVIISGASQA